MKIFVVTAFIALVIPYVYAEDKVGDELAISTERINCYKPNATGAEASDCLKKLRDQSNKEVDSLITKTVNLVKKNKNYQAFGYEETDPTIAEIYVKHFELAQKAWKEYKEHTCKAFTSQVGDRTVDYLQYVYQCEITLNKRHIVELKMLHPDED